MLSMCQLLRRVSCVCTAQCLQGSSFVEGEGQGATVERLYREVRGTAIPGGSEEIMLDLAMRQARL